MDHVVELGAVADGSYTQRCAVDAAFAPISHHSNLDAADLGNFS